VLGGEIEAPAMCPDGLKTGDADSCRAKVKVPEGAQSGDVVRLRGRGMPSLRGRERGDLLVSLKVETPVRLTARQKELMRELAATMATGDGHHPRQTGFFDKAKRFWNGVVGGAEGTAG